MKTWMFGLLPLLAAGCTGDDKEDVVADLGCTETPDELSIEEESPLGFAGRAVTTIAGGDHTATLTWATGDTTELTLSVSYQDGDIRYIDSEPEEPGPGEVAPAISPVCEDRLEVDVVLEAATEDGALAETWDSTLSAYEEQVINLYEELAIDGLTGTLDVASYVTSADYTALSAWISGEITVTGTSGEVAGQASGEDDCGDSEDCSAWAEAVDIGTWSSE